jgi:Protein of unknown function (DUF3710)
VALFKRGRGVPDDEPAQPIDDFEYAVDADEDAGYDDTGYDDAEYDTDGYGGPYDEHEAPDDDMARLDLCSVRLPLPADAQVQVEMDPDGPLRAVHVLTPNARFTIGAYAAPRSGSLWPEISRELAEQLHGDGARVRRENGEWGTELVAFVNDVLLRFVGVDGPRWMLRAVSAGPKETSAKAAEELRDIVRDTIVVRGDQPMPVRTPLPLELPGEIAEHIEQAKAGEGQPG